MKEKFRNPYFIAGIISTIFLAGGIDFESLTSWGAFLDAILAILNNPVAIIAVICNVTSLIKGDSYHKKLENNSDVDNLNE